MAPAFPPQIRDALARLRWAVRRSSPQQLVLLHYVLATLAGNALARVTVTMGGGVEVGQDAKPSQGPLFISVADASTRYPVSRSFLYESGEKEGVVTRPTGNRGKVVVNVRALERWLGRRG